MTTSRRVRPRLATDDELSVPGRVAALYLLNDDIEHCHAIAQRNEGVRRAYRTTADGQDPTADLLHATLHRREGKPRPDAQPPVLTLRS